MYFNYLTKYLQYLGFETSSSTSCFVLYALALNQDKQEKLRNEIKTVLAKNKGELTYEGMQEMKYLQMVIDGNFYSTSFI